MSIEKATEIKSNAKCCRVSERCCHRSLPLEPDRRLSPHPARAVVKSSIKRTGNTHEGAALTIQISRLQPEEAWISWLRTHTRLASRSFAFPHAKVQLIFSSVTTSWKSARLRGGVETPTPIRPITGRPLLSPAFLCPPSPQPSLRSAFLLRGRMRGFTMFPLNSDG